MKESSLIRAVCALAFSACALSTQAASLSIFAFQSATGSCISEIAGDCSAINSHGLTGTFRLDLDALDATGNGSIAWSSFSDFSATNSVSSWNLGSLRAGGVTFSNWVISDFGIDAFPDFSGGWDRSTDGGGESLLIDGFGISAPAPAFSNSGSMPGFYCPSTGEWNSANCPGGDVNVRTRGIQATYAGPSIHPVPLPATLLLFGSGLAVLISIRRRIKGVRLD